MTNTTEMLLRMPEVCRRTGRTRDQVYRDIRAGLFPAPLGARSRYGSRPRFRR